jgi:hypothetical protein
MGGIATSEAVTEVRDTLAGSFDPVYRSFIKDVFGIDSIEKKKVYAEFYRQYEDVVLKALQKHNKFTRNFEDLVGRVWLDFTGNASGIGLLEKFFAQASDSQPDLGATITGAEIAEKLGITWDCWRTAIWRHELGAPVWENGEKLRDAKGKVIRKKSVGPDFPKPQPGTGTHQAKTAVYLRAEIAAWYEEDFDAEREAKKAMRAKREQEHLAASVKGPRAKKKSVEKARPETATRRWWWTVDVAKATPKHFANYLKKSILHRFVNFCRTEDRRHKERVWDTFPDQRSAFEDPAPWEDRLESKSDQEERAEIGLLIRRLQATPAAPHVEALLIAMYDEHITIYQAIEKLEGMSETEKRSAIRGVRGYRPDPSDQRQPAIVAA